MFSLSDFGDIKQVPADVTDVVWHDLDSYFYDECVEALNELTSACQATVPTLTSFYVGAGISIFRPSQLPDAKTVLKTLFNYCDQTYTPHLHHAVITLLDVIDQGGYVLMENVLQNLYETVHPRPFHSGSIFDVPISLHRFNVNHSFLARWIQSGNGTVVTTNLDPLIEQAWHATSPTSVNLRVIKRPDDFSNWRTAIGTPNVLWKVHGSADDPETWAITLSKVGFELSDARVHLLEHLISEHNLCFIGYRAADLDLFPPILTAQTSKGQTKTKVFWVFYFRDGYRTAHTGKRMLDDYLACEPNIRKLFEANPLAIRPIVTTAERLTTWLRFQCFGETSIVPTSHLKIAPHDYAAGLRKDVDVVGYTGASKLVGVTLRTVGKHTEALETLDHMVNSIQKSAVPLDEQTIRQTAQLWQESAQVSHQQGNLRDALRKLDRAWKLLENSDDDLGRAWCQYGRVTMTLDAKEGVSIITRAQAFIRLIRLRGWFQELSESYPNSTSPLLGQGLTLFYEVKFADRLFSALGLLHIVRLRQFLLTEYTAVEETLRKTEFLRSLPDVLRRKAYLLVVDAPEQAVNEIIKSLRTAEVVSTSHLEIACQHAHSLAQGIQDTALRKQLLEAVDQYCITVNN